MLAALRGDVAMILRMARDLNHKRPENTFLQIFSVLFLAVLNLILKTGTN
jgi:hypothetical protein